MLFHNTAANQRTGAGMVSHATLNSFAEFTGQRRGIERSNNNFPTRGVFKMFFAY